VAIAHDYLTQRGGAERVVLALLRAYPDAAVHTLLYDPDRTFPEFRDVRVVTSRINRLAPLRRHHRAALPALASAASRMPVDADVTVVSTSGWAHGFDIRGRSIVYCHNPARWLYQPDDYLGRSTYSLPALALRALGPALRRWDRTAMLRHDRHLANASVVRDRMRAAYGIDADVVFPPAVIASTGGQESTVGPFDPGYHLLVSRLLPYKNVDKAVEAFRSLPRERLLVVGRGPEAERLRRLLPANVAIVSDISDDQLRWAYRHCAALVAPSIEDLGLTPLEAGAFGKPTVALRYGGYLDTVAEGVTGLFFESADPEAIARAVEAARRTTWHTDAIRAHGLLFAESTFRARVVAAVDDVLARS
jgi:glycosyltransferase involved in cell wall biosynthesis